jgi:hypothetical protein
VDKQNSLALEILRRLNKEGILDQAMLIGSWAAYFYKNYFKNKDYHPVIKTRDIDFLLPKPVRFRKKVDLEGLLSDLGFEIEHSNNGYMRLESVELILEMLIPETGAGRDKPYPLPEIKFNAQPLRHLSMLWREPVEVNVGGISLRLPHPADYCLNKLIIRKKRKKKDKQEKDLKSALSVLEALQKENQIQSVFAGYQKLSRNAKKAVLDSLIEKGHAELAQQLKLI